MNSSRREETRRMEDPLKFSWQPELRSPYFVLGWSVDAGRLGAGVIDYLNKSLSGQRFCEIEPVEFYPLSGVNIEDNIVQFPENEFYACPKNDLVLFKSTPPSHEWYKYFSLTLDVAENYHARELYIVSGMISLSAHTPPRQLWGTCNSSEFKNAMSRYKIVRELDYTSPPRQRPTLNSFLLWAAQKRNIPGISLMVPIPFYLATVGDPKAERRVLEFFTQRFNLRMDFSDLDEEIRQQSQMIYELRKNILEIDDSINRLESNLRLSEEESQRLVKEIDKHLREKSA
jgi:proteasome assembly chaperone (PAC2) family protein